MFTSSRQCVEFMSRPYRFKVKVTLEGQMFEALFRVCSISPRRLEGFLRNLSNMFTSLRQCAEPMSRPYRFKVKVTLKGQRFEALFRFRSISPRRLEGFSWSLGHMFTSSRHCAEPMYRPSRVKVTLEGQRFEALFRVQDAAKDFTEVQSHVLLINMMCRTRTFSCYLPLLMFSNSC